MKGAASHWGAVRQGAAYHFARGLHFFAEALLRTVLLLLASAGLFAQSPLDVASGLPGMVDRHLTEIAKRLWEERSARVAQMRTPAAVKDRQAYIRRTLIEEVGGFPEKTPLHARITGTLQRDGY